MILRTFSKNSRWDVFKISRWYALKNLKLEWLNLKRRGENEPSQQNTDALSDLFSMKKSRVNADSASYRAVSSTRSHTFETVSVRTLNGP